MVAGPLGPPGAPAVATALAAPSLPAGNAPTLCQPLVETRALGKQTGHRHAMSKGVQVRAEE